MIYWQRFNKIIATLWPAIDRKWILKKIDKFIDIYRINLSHANLIKTRKIIKDIRVINARKVFMLDTKWPEIRTNNEEIIELKNNEIVRVYNKAKKWYLSFEYKFFQNIPTNIQISFDDNEANWIILKNNWEYLEIKILNWWTIGYNKTVNFIWYEPELDCLTEKDKEDIKFMVAENIALLAVSFIKNHTDILKIKKYIKENFDNYDAKIIAKIETVSAINDIENIIKYSDWVMIARWDLWANMDIIELPKIQQKIIKLCNMFWKPVILATQVISSMVNKPIPTRAEVDEIAYNIQMWVDVFMLSNETAIWKYPIETLSILNDVISFYQKDVKNLKFSWEDIETFVDKNNQITDYILYNAKKIASKLKVKFIITPTSIWYTPWKISALKPNMPILSFTDSDKVFKYCNLMFWVESYKIWENKLSYEWLKKIIWETLQHEFRGNIKGEDKILIVHSTIKQNVPNMINWIEVIKFKDL